MLGDLAGSTAVDLGAGSGAASRALAALGAEVIGVEPNAAARARAAEAGGGPTYRAGTGEATGLPAASADLVLFSMSLHHCGDMPAALSEALRVLRPGGRLAVAEPEPHDPMAPVMRFIDDETEVYLAAQAALDAAEARGAVTDRTTLRYAGRYRTDSVDALLEDLVFVESGRSLDPADRPALEAAFEAAHAQDAAGGFLPYWMRLDVMRKPG